MLKNFQGEVMILKFLDIFALGIFLAFKKLLNNFGQNQNMIIVKADNFYNVYICQIWLARDVRPGIARESQNMHAC